MLDIGLFELLLIGIVALLVLGPEKMPGAVRTAVLWIGRVKRSFNKVKNEIEQQIDADDIRRQLHNESILADIEKAKKNANKLIEDTQSEIDETRDQVKRNVDDIKKMPIATNSAEEGIPTGEQGNDEIAETTPPIAASAPETGDTTPAPAASEPLNEVQEQMSSPAETSSVQQQETDTRDDASAPAKKEKPVVEDFYNTPPEGIVSIHGSTVVGNKQDSDASDDDSEADSAKS